MNLELTRNQGPGSVHEMYRELPLGVTVRPKIPTNPVIAECASRIQVAEFAAGVQSASPRIAHRLKPKRGSRLPLQTKRGRFS